MNAATPWVLLRGLMRDSRHWGQLPKRLKVHFPEAPVVCLDLPGNGLLNAQPSPLRIEDAARYCRAALIQQGLPPPYRVLAMSMGAMVTAAWADAQPQELAACVLVNTSLRPYSRFYERLRPANYATVLRMALRDGEPREVEAEILRMTSAHMERNSLVLDDWAAWRRSHPVSRLNALRQLYAAGRFVASRTAPRVPTLVLVGARDTLVNPECSRRLAQAWQCPLREHPDAGHDLPLDDAAWVVQQIAEWTASGSTP